MLNLNIINKVSVSLLMGIGMLIADFSVAKAQEWETQVQEHREFAESWEAGEIETQSVEESDSLALVAFYEATNGDEWNDNTNWLEEGQPVETWEGVHVKDGVVGALVMPSNAINGDLPPEIGDLSGIISINMIINQISSIPPEIGQLSTLETLNLAGNHIEEIPPEIGQLENLEFLNLENNELEGPIPSEIGNLSNLYHLELRRNELSGSLPHELGQLDNLEELILNSNELSGEIPPELGNLSNITDIRLGANNIDGLPPEISNLQTLEILSISGNDLSGEFPSAVIELENLESLILSFNELSGEIPTEIQEMQNLRSLSVVDNELTGEIPPQLSELSSLEYLSLSENNLTGAIPAALANLENLTELRVHANNLAGNIPPEIGELTELDILFLQQNAFTGPIPEEIGELTQLRSLDVSGNALEGEVPESLLKLTELNAFFTGFSYNMLTADNQDVIEMLDELDEGWDETQTVSPENLQVNSQNERGNSTLSTESVTVSWDPIAYTGDDGHYIVRYGNDPAALVDTVSTEDKTVSSLQIEELDSDNEYFFTVQTRTQPHEENPNDLTSPSQEIIDEDGEVLADPPAAPALSFPGNGVDNVSTSVTFEWGDTENAETYQIQIASDSDFDTIIDEASEITETEYHTDNLSFDSEHHWRVRAENENGISGDWSSVWSFTTVTEVPDSPELVAPEDGIEEAATEDLTLEWQEVERAEAYHLQLAEDDDFENIIMEEQELEEPEYQIAELEGNQTHHWRVRAENEDGISGDWSSVWSFTTGEFVSAEDQTDLPDTYAMHQNYPNPFNPATRIRYEIPEQTEVRLTVYDMLGQRVATLVDEQQSAGSYEVAFETSNLSSGTYIYRLEAGEFTETKQMMFVK